MRRLRFLRRDPLHIRHDLPDEGAVAVSLRVHNAPAHNTAFSKRFPDGDGVNIVKVVLFLLGVEVVGLNELRNTPLHLRPRQFNGFRASGADDKKAFAFIPSILAGEPCGGFFFASVLLHIPHYGVLALDISVPCTECIVYIVLRERTQQIMEPGIGSLKSLSVQAAAELRHIRK